MPATSAQRRQAQSMPRPDAEDGPWTVSVAECPHQPSFDYYALTVQTPTHELLLLRSEREMVELNRQLCDAYPGIPCPAFPIRPLALAEPAEPSQTSHRPLLHSTSLGRSSAQMSQNIVSTSASTHRQAPVEVSVSEHTTKIALAWYLTALSNDPFFRRVPPWKDFVQVRPEDFKSPLVERADRPEAAVWDSVMPNTNLGSQGETSGEDRLSVDASFEDPGHVENMELSSWAAHTWEGKLPDAHLSDFEMVRTLGIGSKGKVILVRHKNTSAPYALKVMYKRRVLENQEMHRTLAEQAVLRRMADEGTNPFVIWLWWAFHDTDNLYLVMDFHPGGDLRTLLDRRKFLGNNLSFFYAAELVDGIESLHAAGIIHRNLKPEHILIEENGHIVICGFGKSKVFRRSAASSRQQSESNHADTAHSLCGTAEYFAPEVIKGLPYSYGVDWWALGTILYEMLMGARPFDADNMPDMFNRILQDELEFPEDRFIDQDTKPFIQGLLQRNPAQRLSEPEIKQHPYFSKVDWPDMHDRRYKPPDIPPMDPSNLYDTQNFDKAFLEIKPMISDEMNADGAQEGENTDLGSSDDTCQECDVDGVPSIIIEGMPEDKEVRGSPETVPGHDNPVRLSILKPVALWQSTHPTQQRPESPERDSPPVNTQAILTASLTSATLLAARDIHIQARLRPADMVPDAVTDREGAHRYMGPGYGLHRNSSDHRNVRRRRRNQENTGAPGPDSHLSDTDDDNDDEARKGHRNHPWDFEKIDGRRDNGAHSPTGKSEMSKRSFSTIGTSRK